MLIVGCVLIMFGVGLLLVAFFNTKNVSRFLLTFGNTRTPTPTPATPKTASTKTRTTPTPQLKQTNPPPNENISPLQLTNVQSAEVDEFEGFTKNSALVNKWQPQLLKYRFCM